MRSDLLITIPILFTVAVACISTAAAASTHQQSPHQVLAYASGTSEQDIKVTTLVNASSSFPTDLFTREGVLAAAIYNATQNTTGWSTFSVKGNYPPHQLQRQRTELVHFAAGYLEGYLTAQSIIDNYLNVFSTAPLPAPVADWIETNIAFIDRICGGAIGAEPLKLANASAEFVTQLCRQHSQVRGIYEGVLGCPEVPWQLADTSKNFGGFKWTRLINQALQMEAEIMDLFTATNASMMMMNAAFLTSGLRNSRQDQQHCSAFVKLTDNDLAIGHTTFAKFNMLLRIWKIYQFDDIVIQMSSYPGSVAVSNDDFYTLTTVRSAATNDGNATRNMAVVETTFENYNTSLIQQYVTPFTIPFFLRVSVANFAAWNAMHWSELFLTLNSGTYADEWLVVDFNKVSFENNKSKLKLSPGTLVVVDQMPGSFSVSQDLTALLEKETYIASYNIPRFKSVYELSGNSQMLATYKNAFFSFEHAPRANIFRRDQHNISSSSSSSDNNGDHDATVTGVQTILRTNGYYNNDPLLRIPGCVGCKPELNPGLAVCARGDLVDPTATYGSLNGTYMQGYFQPSAFAGTDTKVTAFSLFHSRSGSSCAAARAISGPTTYDGMPPLVLSKLAERLQMQLYGTFDGPWQFPWQQFNSCVWNNIELRINNQQQRRVKGFNKYTAIGIGLGAALVVALIAVATHRYCVTRNSSSGGANASDNIQSKERIANEATALI